MLSKKSNYHMMIIDQLKIHVDNEASRFDDRLHRTMEAITGEGREGYFCVQFIIG